MARSPHPASGPPLTPVVYTMGKVASTSVADALAGAGLPNHHIHTLNPDYLLDRAGAWIGQGRFPPPHICLSMALREKLFLHKAKCLYISLVRDPVARNLSAFFQNLHLQPPAVQSESDPVRLLAAFRANHNHTEPLDWFDREFRAQLKIDIYDRPFDTKERYSHMPAKNTLIFRTDCPDDRKAAVLSRITGREIALRRLNDGRNKPYADRYNALKALARFPEAFLSDIYDSRFARHFWSEEERGALLRKWSGAA